VDLFKIEIDLVHFQFALQEAMAADKDRIQQIQNEVYINDRDREIGYEEQLKSLKVEADELKAKVNIRTYVFNLSRRFGDAFAWLLFKTLRSDFESHISTLSENQRIPPVREYSSMLGVLYAARHFAALGAGFPIIHDATTILRIGDITFIAPDNTPITVEIKTRVREEGQHYHIDILSATGDIKRWESIVSNAKQATQTGEPVISVEQGDFSSKRFRDRELRQLQRMKKVQKWTSAQWDVLIDDKDKSGFKTVVDLRGKTNNWDKMLEVAQRAKEEGYAVCEIDNAAVYCAMYSTKPHAFSGALNSDLSEEPEAQKALKAMADEMIVKNIFSRNERNLLWMSGTHKHLLDSAPSQVRPLFLYPFPADLVIDLMWGRLAIMVCVNLGKVAEAIKESGLNATVPANQSEADGGFLSISKNIELSDGRHANIELRNMKYYGQKLLHDALTIPAFVSQLTHVADISTKIAEQEFAKSIQANSEK
jgi:hypothetical protein